MNRLWKFLPALVATIGLAIGAQRALAVEGATGAASQAAVAEAAPETASIPIELPEAPAQPSPDELVGGFHGFFIFLGIVLFVGIVAGAIAHGSHHDWYDDCEDDWHHCHH